MPLVEKPDFFPSEGAYSTTSVWLSTQTTEAQIFYTIGVNPPNPTTSDIEYDWQAIPIAQPMVTIKAIAVKKGWQPSGVMTATYFVTQTQPPRICPDAGNYESPLTVWITPSHPSETIFYTVDGTDPHSGSRQYSGPFLVESTKTIKAISVNPSLLQSNPAESLFTISSANIDLTGHPWKKMSKVVADLAQGDQTVEFSFSFVAPGTEFHGEGVNLQAIESKDHVFNKISHDEFKAVVADSFNEWKALLETTFSRGNGFGGNLTVNMVNLGDEVSTEFPIYDIDAVRYPIPNSGNVGDIRIAMIAFGGSYLAFAYLPCGSYVSAGGVGGDVFFDSEDWWIKDGQVGGYNLKLVTCHELGHCFGLGHSTTQGLMYPYITYGYNFYDLYPNGLGALPGSSFEKRGLIQYYTNPPAVPVVAMPQISPNVELISEYTDILITGNLNYNIGYSINGGTFWTLEAGQIIHLPKTSTIQAIAFTDYGDIAVFSDITTKNYVVFTLKQTSPELVIQQPFASDSSLYLFWNQPTEQCSYYQLIVNRVLRTERYEELSCVLSGLTAGTRYQIGVIAYDQAGTELYRSNDIWALTLQKFDNPSVDVGYNYYSILWGSHPQAVMYLLYAGYPRPDNEIIDIVPPGHQYDNRQVAPSTEYTVTIVAINKSQVPFAAVTTTFSTLAVPIRDIPALVSPPADFSTVDATPELCWMVPEGNPGEKYDFLVEIAEDKTFTKNVRKYNSFVNKDGFSFRSPREAGSGEIVKLKLPFPLK